VAHELDPAFAQQVLGLELLRPNAFNASDS